MYYIASSYVYIYFRFALASGVWSVEGLRTCHVNGHGQCHIRSRSHHGEQVQCLNLVASYRTISRVRVFLYMMYITIVFMDMIFELGAILYHVSMRRGNSTLLARRNSIHARSPASNPEFTLTSRKIGKVFARLASYQRPWVASMESV